ncbi:MAG: hypothetical protein RML95_01410 [Anaerolineae bacterium]|nr:hypothetical protein [Anaerolineae bacterium]MDW8297972.1 hypothetical protein [Anaerolineae bacterium]
MLTFISGWRSADRDIALLKHRDPTRHAVFFIDNLSSLPHLLTDLPIIDVWRNGPLDFQIDDNVDTIVRINYDTDHDLIVRSVAHMLLSGSKSQPIIAYDATQYLYRLFPALRAAGALLAADERLDAPSGDRVLFTRGGSFAWRDHLLESQTAQLVNSEVLDGGIVPDPEEIPE